MVKKGALALFLAFAILDGRLVTSATPEIPTRASVPNLADQATLGAEGNQGAFAPAVSNDTGPVAFESHATNLVVGDTNSFNNVFVHDRGTSTTRRVSVAVGGSQASGNSWDASVSADGRFVTFYSQAGLVPEDANPFGEHDVYVHDLLSGTTSLISVNAAGTQAAGFSSDAAINANGRFVAFKSGAPLVAGDTNGMFDIYVRDRDTDQNGQFDEPGAVSTQRVSVDSAGNQANGVNEDPVISADGRFVAFMTGSSSLVGAAGIVVHDRMTGATSLASKASSGNPANRGGYSPSISADGRLVAFHSDSSNLVVGDTNTCTFFSDPGTCPDIFVHDQTSGETERISVSSAGDQSDGGSFEPSLSADGRYVAFWSFASNLVSDDNNTCSVAYLPSCPDVFVHDRASGVTLRVSVPGPGVESTGATHGGRGAAISASGRYVVYHSDATNLIVQDSNGVTDVFVSDLGDQDGDGEWDPFDATTDYDGDQVTNGTEYSCGSDGLGPVSVPERLDTPGDDDGDTLINEPLPPGAAAYDCDGDGYIGSIETHVTTGDQDPCGGTGWPSDLNPSTSGGFQYNTLNVQDIASFITPMRRFGTSPGHPDFNARWDLVPGSTFGAAINLVDVAATLTGASGYPPMFGGQRAFGKTCPWSP